MLTDGYEIEQDGPLLTARIAGPEFSHEQILDLVEECKEKLRYDSARTFVFDMEQVTFLASACIGALVDLMREIEPMRGRIALAGCQDNVAFLFKVTKLDDIFALFDDIDTALEELADDLR